MSLWGRKLAKKTTFELLTKFQLTTITPKLVMEKLLEDQPILKRLTFNFFRDLKTSQLGSKM